jgi:tetratricopeptide (TPR) repeat protein
MSIWRWFQGWLARGEAAPDTPAASPGADRTPAAQRALAERHYVEGAQHLASGRLAEAEAALARALECRHDHAEALLLQGVVHLKAQRVEDAADSFLLAMHFRPDYAEAHFYLGVLAERQGRTREALAAYDLAIAANPGYAEAYNARGAMRLRNGDPGGAVDDFRRALELKPEFHQAHANLGCVLITRLDRFDEGAPHLERAWRLAPEDPDVMCNRAMLLQYRGSLSEALALYDRLIERDAQADEARLNRALLLLKQGEFARGWPDYEARKRIGWGYTPREFPVPEWKGEPLSGRTVLVHAEQGLGDQIMFASCIPDLARRAAHCVVESPRKLEALFRRSFPSTTVIETGTLAAGKPWPSGVPRADCHVAIGSLPWRFRNALADFPAHDGYLEADPGKVAAWRRRLAGLPGARKIGVSWRGGMKSSRQSLRSVPLERWLPIFGQPDAAFVSLQYTECRSELGELERQHRVRVHHWQEAIDDYDETAALVCALDLVLSVQTSIVHLGGALGRPVWVMVPAVAEWRYLQSGGRMPWYPSVRVWRQHEAGDWDTVIGSVARALAAPAACQT